MRKRIIGVDESNHGRFPEIYVAVLARLRKDYEYKPFQFEKIHDSKTNLTSMMGGRQYTYLILQQEHKDLVGHLNIKLIALAEMIKSFSPLHIMIFDGDLEKTFLSKGVERLERLLHPLPLPYVDYGEKGDLNYQIVNLADRAANRLYRHYTHLDDAEWIRNERIYRKHRINFDFDYHVKKLLQMKENKHAYLLELLSKTDRHEEIRKITKEIKFLTEETPRLVAPMPLQIQN